MNEFIQGLPKKIKDHVELSSELITSIVKMSKKFEADGPEIYIELLKYKNELTKQTKDSNLARSVTYQINTFLESLTRWWVNLGEESDKFLAVVDEFILWRKKNVSDKQSGIKIPRSGRKSKKTP